MTETVLRVIQALTIKSTFTYWLSEQDINDLTQLGYVITIIESDEFFRISFCRISR